MSPSIRARKLNNACSNTVRSIHGRTVFPFRV